MTVKENYKPRWVPFNYRSFTGTHLDLHYNRETTITAPFPIHFGDDPAGYTSLTIASSGAISFTGSALNAFVLPYPWAQTLIAPFSTDLDPASGSVYWDVIGTAPNRELVVEWRNVYLYNQSYSDPVTFQAVFFENSSDVLFNYADVMSTDPPSFSAGGLAIVGVQIDSTLAQQHSYFTPSLRNNLALLFKMRHLKPEAGPDQVVLPGSAVTLRMGAPAGVSTVRSCSTTGSRPPGPRSSCPVPIPPNPGFTAPSEAGTLSFRLTVTDGSGYSG